MTIAENGATLTRREKQIIALVIRGVTVKEIAGALGVQPKTVHQNLYNVRDRFDLHSLDALVKYVKQHGLLDQEVHP